MDPKITSIFSISPLEKPQTRGCGNCLFWMSGSGCCHCEGNQCRDAVVTGQFRYWRPIVASASKPPFKQRLCPDYSSPAAA